MNPYGTSGYQSLHDLSTNFEFNASGTSKLGVENPTFSSNSSLSKPRMVKSRKSLNSKSKGSSETRKNDLGYNPFRLFVENVPGVASRVDDNAQSRSNVGYDDGGGGDGDGVTVNKSRHLKLKVSNKVEKVGNELIDEIRKMRIANDFGSSRSDSSRLADKLNDRDNVVNGSKGLDSGLPSELSQELKKMNIGPPDQGSDVTGASRGGDGGGGGGSSAVPLGAQLPNDMRKLNLRGSDVNVTGASRGGDGGGGSSSVPLGARLPNDMRKLNLGDNGDVGGRSFAFSTPGNSDSLFGSSKAKKIDSVVVDSTLPENIKNLKLEDPLESNDTPRTGMNDNDTLVLGQMEKLNIGVASSSLSENVFLAGEKDTGSTEKRGDFSFCAKQEGTRMSNVEFTTPAQKDGLLFNASNINLGFRSKKGMAKVSPSRGKKGKVKVPHPVGIFSPMETSMQHEPSNSYSPMDISPYREVQNDSPQSDREASLPANDAADEQLATATQRMDINDGNDLKHGINTDVDRKSDLDNDGQSEVESKYEGVEDSGQSQTRYFSASSSVSSGGSSSFRFAAAAAAASPSSSSSHGQASAALRHQRKKNRMKDLKVIPPLVVDSFSDPTSSLQYSPVSNVPKLPSQLGKNDGVYNAPFISGISTNIASPTRRAADAFSVEETKRGIASPTAAARAAHEACEKWRLRGNQSYANGDLKKAEECYTQGLSCIPRHETFRDCLRSLVLCYSNRAAARMSIGRMIEALQDCLVAIEIDPNFFRVQLRAASCYLALGEISNASRYFKKLLQSNDVCVERKIMLEASDGLQKAQKVSECLDRSTYLLEQKTDTETALRIITEALVISPYSDQLLENKATALFILRRYEEVIQLCEDTMETAEKNCFFFVGAANEELSSSDNMDAEILENYSFRTWRFGLIFKSNFYLGKLEEGLEFLEKHEKWNSMAAKFGIENLESLIPQLSTVRELVRHKSAGNRAFQLGRHTEAIEHYSAALSFNVESRPFAAVCFGNRAAAYQALGQITDAIADCSLAIALDSNYLKAISRRATLFELIRDYDQAGKDLERIVTLLTKQQTAEEKGTIADLRQARLRLYQMEEHSKRGIPLNFYLILGTEASVTATDLRKAYRKAALRHHPDKAGQALARSESGDDGLWKEIADEVYKDTDKLFKMIGEAYAVLSDPTKRSQYDIEEEMRNGTKKNTSRMPNDGSNYAEERGGVGRQWREREGWRSNAGPYSRGFEPTRPSGRYY